MGGLVKYQEGLRFSFNLDNNALGPFVYASIFSKIGFDVFHKSSSGRILYLSLLYIKVFFALVLIEAVLQA